MPDCVRQAAAIPLRGEQLCLITSRSGRRWVVPKGQIEHGYSPSEAALIEAWEEAGLVGLIENEPIGSYRYSKLNRDYHVLVYRMVVTEIADFWPERLVRQRAWLSVSEALHRIEERGLRHILGTLCHPANYELFQDPVL